MAAHLRTAGGMVTHHRFEGQVHGFFSMDLIFGDARRAHRLVARAMTDMPQRSTSAAAPMPNAFAGHLDQSDPAGRNYGSRSFRCVRRC